MKDDPEPWRTSIQQAELDARGRAQRDYDEGVQPLVAGPDAQKRQRIAAQKLIDWAEQAGVFETLMEEIERLWQFLNGEQKVAALYQWLPADSPLVQRILARMTEERLG